MSNQTPLLGVFDSGVGGFSVYRKIRSASSANCIYYGDCMRAPYGNRDEAEIIAFIKDDIQFLKDEGVTHFVNACNSMSVMTTDTILQECQVSSERYTDMIRAFSKRAQFAKDEVVLVMATEATIRSRVYQDFLDMQGVMVFEYPFRNLAGLIEASATRENIIPLLLDGMKYAKQVGATKIIYGCTHYPLVHDYFQEVAETISWLGEFIDPAQYVGEEVASWGLSGERRFTPYSSKDTPAFIKNVISFL